MKLTVSLLLTLFAGLLMPMRAVAAETFNDVSETHIYADAVLYLKGQGIVEGYADGTFRPEALINRAEFLKIAVETFEDESVLAKCTTNANLPFSDTQDTSWYAPYICASMQHGASNPVQGYPDGTFKPAQNISFVEASKIIHAYLKIRAGAEASEYEVATPYKDWFAVPVTYFEQQGAIPNTIEMLSQSITRGEMAEMIYRLENMVVDKETQTLEWLLSGASGLSIGSEKGVIRLFYERLSFDESMMSAYQMLNDDLSFQDFERLYHDVEYSAVYNIEYNQQSKEYSYQVIMSTVDGEKRLQHVKAKVLGEDSLDILSQKELTTAVLEQKSFMHYTTSVRFVEGDLELQLCDGNTCTVLKTIEAGEDTIFADFSQIVYSPDGRFLRFDLVFGEGMTTIVVNTETKEVLHNSIIGADVKGFTADSAYYYTCTPLGLYEGYVAVYDLETFEEVFSAQGEMLTCGSYSASNGTFTYYETPEGEEQIERVFDFSTMDLR